MKYMGSKARIAKDILPIILKEREPEQWYIEPFAGGMNIIDKVDGNRIANDIHFELIEMWKSLVNEEWKPSFYTREDYKAIKLNRQKFDPKIIGWVGFNVSYCGTYFGGYAGLTKTKDGSFRNYQEEAIKNVSKQIDGLKGVVFLNNDYRDLIIPEKSIIYCDIPYKGVTGYSHFFDHKIFWNWARIKSNEGHKVFISEYQAPKDFKCIWEKRVKSSLSANGITGSSKTSTEKLFVYDN